MLTPNNNKEKIHVLEVLGNAIVGGMENYVRNLIDRLPDQFQVTCLCPYESAMTASLRQLGCDVFVTFMDTDPRWRSIQSTVEIVRHQHIDLLHAHMPKAHVLAGLTGRLTQTPVVATIHGMEITAEELGISRTTGTHLVVVCHEARNQALALGVPPERITLIHNGVDLEKYKPGSGDNAFRSNLNIPPGAPLVGFVGRLAWEKGPDQFIHAAKVVHNQRPDVHFVLVGQGHMEDELSDMIEDMDLDHCVHLAGLRTDTWNVYPALDILVQTSRIEGMPLVLLEAMASGCPVVAMGVGGILELVEVGTTGLLSAPGDWEGIGDAVLSLLEHPAQIKQMGQAARQRAEALFDLENSVHLTSDLFWQLAASDRNRRAGKTARRAAANGVR
ncbi:MAG TPA: glycosyltransferase [Anaerolineae bacterium]